MPETTPKSSAPLFITANCCTARWTGASAAHCSGCHQTFTSASGFTAHRKAAGCVDPSELGMVRLERKAWTGWAFPGSWEGPDAA